MEHIDEGTIHAWLDGALPASEGARIEAHVASCAECASAVAEARGLIAASSRILSALDDVPGGVIPVAVVTGESATRAEPDSHEARTNEQGASVVGALSGMAGGAGADRAKAPPAARASRRPWYRRPQWAAAAGISFLAVAATAVWQKSGSPTVMESARLESEAAAPMTAAEPAADAVLDSAAPGGSVGASSAGASAVASTKDVPASQQAAAPRALRADGATANEAKRLAESAPAESRKEFAVAKRAVQGDTVPARAEAASERDVARQAPRPAAPPPQPAAATATRERSATDTNSAKRVGANLADAIVRSETARAAGDASAQRKASSEQLQNVVVTGTGASARRSAVAQAPVVLRASGGAAAPASPSMLAGCYRLLPADLAHGLGIRTLLQLEFAGAGSDESRPAYAARAVGVGNVQQAITRDALRWTMSSNGEVVIVRGEGAAAQRVTMRIGVPLDSLANQQLQGTRTPCPE